MAGGTDTPLGAVLAGGSGSRLGGAKATVELAGRPLLSYPLAAFAAAGIEPLVVAKPETQLPPLDCPILREPEAPRHPLAGIVAALREAGERPLVVLACDMPLAAPALLAELAAAPEPLVVPAPNGHLAPLQARYSAALLPALEAALERREPLRRTVEALSPRLLDDAELALFGDPERLFLNVNDPLDLRRAAGMLGR
ncbi:MAG: molybdenum cofactor guanylyltransferase [Solirubrobacterales bacterium]|jgi:molybdopterin-guanine dinucleotide biosynthesis protein A|nr:molybdenum cofactor guanylyltransferase [Solirubrobacterales bacterium]